MFGDHLRIGTEQPQHVVRHDELRAAVLLRMDPIARFNRQAFMHRDPFGRSLRQDFDCPGEDAEARLAFRQRIRVKTIQTAESGQQRYD